MLPSERLFQLRASRGEKLAAKKAAGWAGLTLSAWCRQQIRNGAVAAYRAMGLEPEFMDEAIRGAPKGAAPKKNSEVSPPAEGPRPEMPATIPRVDLTQAESDAVVWGRRPYDPEAPRPLVLHPEYVDAMRAAGLELPEHVLSQPLGSYTEQTTPPLTIIDDAPVPRAIAKKPFKSSPAEDRQVRVMQVAVGLLNAGIAKEVVIYGRDENCFTETSSESSNVSSDLQSVSCGTATSGPAALPEVPRREHARMAVVEKAEGAPAPEATHPVSAGQPESPDLIDDVSLDPPEE